MRPKGYYWVWYHDIQKWTIAWRSGESEYFDTHTDYPWREDELAPGDLIGPRIQEPERPNAPPSLR